MPIYEFYCRPCHTIFQYYARKVDTSTIPPCPNCGAPLSRQVSAVAYLRGGGDGGADGLGDVRADSDRVNRALEAIGGDFSKLEGEGDPKKAAELMRKFSDISGLRFNGDIEDALSRMADGADPDAVGDELESMVCAGDEAFTAEDRGKRKARIIEVPAFKDPALRELAPQEPGGQETTREATGGAK